jgi:N-glycosylase/DNA lyase
MMQTVSAILDGKMKSLLLPGPNNHVLPGVKWGHHYATFTPAFWATLAWIDETHGAYSRFRLGSTLEEEIAACLLGGHGISAETGLAAFYRVRDYGLLRATPISESALYESLSVPLLVGGREVRYRFAQQRSKYVSAALNHLHDTEPPTYDDLAFRQWLLKLTGIGPKTASWITRNWLESDRVAIIDIHIHRAGMLMGLYGVDETPDKHYFKMESKFLAFATGIGVKASILDALIWLRSEETSQSAACAGQAVERHPLEAHLPLAQVASYVRVSEFGRMEPVLSSQLRAVPH